MKNYEVKALQKEYNETVEKGRQLWEQITPMANRCNEILKILRDNKVEFDEVALIFGGELDVETAGKDEDDY